MYAIESSFPDFFPRFRVVYAVTIIAAFGFVNCELHISQIVRSKL